jgi:probable phosphoglycerate mutase
VRGGLAIDDPPLTDKGRGQADRLAGALAGEQLDEILVSPLQRARQTAAPVLARLGRDEVVDAWLEEIRNPVWQGSPAERAEKAFAEDRARPAHLRWEGLEGGESVRDFVERIHRDSGLFLRERGVERARTDLPVWHIATPGRRIGLIAHAGTLSVLICHLLGLETVPWEWERFVLGHASVTRVEALKVGEGYTFSLTRLSDVEHLAPADRTR